MIDRSLVKVLCVGGVLLFAACGSENMAKDKSELLRGAGEVFGKYYVALKALQGGPTSPAVIQGDELRSAEDCESDLEFWHKEGVSDGDAIFSYDFNAHPKSEKNTVPFSEARNICKQYRSLFARYRAAYDLYRAEGTLTRMREYLKPDDPVITANLIAEYERTSNPKVVVSALKEARKLDPEMKVGKRKLSLDSFETEVAVPLKDVAPKWIADARAAFRARNEKLAAPYIAAGVAGEKLDLVVTYGGVYWRLEGGDRTDDAKKIARASVLFQWLEMKDPEDQRFDIHTIRRYEFDGNRLSGVTEKRYRLLGGNQLSLSVFK